jgi:hypothetical protein
MVVERGVADESRQVALSSTWHFPFRNQSEQVMFEKVPLPWTMRRGGMDTSGALDESSFDIVEPTKFVDDTNVIQNAAEST